ncbi:ABC transporter substrate-binding protein [Candidatus Poribacteria bacterium]|nr:ABC transporter substrate-binding protein [Candidatus Poribacteria bacterium]
MSKFRLIALLLLSVGFIRCSSSPHEDEPVAKSTGQTLHLYSALDTNEAKIYIRAFEEETGINVRWVRMSAGEVLVRVRSERNNPQVGLWFGGPSPEFIAAKQDGLLAPYKPKVDFELLPGTFDEDYYWTGFYFGVLGFACNIEILNRKGLATPTSWDDLMKPELKGEIGVAYPYTSGTSYTILATLAQLMGEEKAFDYIAKLDKNTHHYNKSGSACVTQVGFGEIGVGLAFSHDIVKKGASRGFPVVLSFPKEGTGYEIGAMALIKDGPNQAEAKTFIDWMLSAKAQNLMQKWFRTPLHPKAEVAKGAVTADEVNLIKFDAVWAGKNKRRLIERWREITAQ